MNISDASIGANNQTKSNVKNYPFHLALHQCIESQVESAPSKVAVQYLDKTLSYQELNQQANQLAHYLVELGVGPDVIVAVQMERSLELSVALLAILKAGGAYLPLDPQYPIERMTLILEDADISILLTQKRFVERLEHFVGEVIALDDEQQTTQWLSNRSRETSKNLAIPFSPSQLAYVIYTSGSTGRPKGCMLPHKAIVNRLMWMQDAYQVGPEDRILQKTPYTFDVSVWELFLPLMSGAQLVFARPEGHKDTDYLIDVITKSEITICHFVPSMLRFFLKNEDVSRCASLQKVFVSGEALTYELTCRFYDALDAELHNLYGPTEAAVDVTYWHAKPRLDKKITIGKPIANIQIHILDKTLEPVPVGESGELCIGGVGLARGYLNRPELTAEKFIVDPFSDGPDARLYRTGDKARYWPTGEIEWLGRFDSQIKLRGFRIELGEIENTLRHHPDIDDAAVLVKDAETDDPKLVAFLVAKDLTSKSVRDYVKSHLPEYMVPNRVNFLDAIPVTVHGKADKKALLALKATQPESEVKFLNESKRELKVEKSHFDQEAFIAGLQAYFIELLELDSLSPEEDLFDYGATSFTLVQAVHKIHQEQGVRVPVEVFLDSPTVASVARYVQEKRTPLQRSKALQTASSQERSSPALPLSDTCNNEAPSEFKALQADSNNPNVIQLDKIDFQTEAYLKSEIQSSAIHLEALGQFLSLLREVRVNDQAKYLYASAGGLNAVQVYLYVAEDGVKGLPAGAYYYQPKTHELIALHSTQQAYDTQNNNTLMHLPHLADSRFAVFLVGEREAIEPIYTNASGSLLLLEAGYIEQMLLMRQKDYDLALKPLYGVNTYAVNQLFNLHLSHVVLHTLIDTQVETARNGLTHSRMPGLSNILFRSDRGFSLPDKEIIEQLHKKQLQIRQNISESSKDHISLSKVNLPEQTFQYRASKRQYESTPLTTEQIDQLLSLLRSDQKSQKLYWVNPETRLDFYIQLNETTTSQDETMPVIPAGVYRYDPQLHQLLPQFEGVPEGIKNSFTPFNRHHGAKATFKFFIVGKSSQTYGPHSRYFNLLEAGRIGQLLLEHQTEFGVGLCPIGALMFDKIESAFKLDDGAEWLHGLVGGPTSLRLPLQWPRLQMKQNIAIDNDSKAFQTSHSLINDSNRKPEHSGAMAIVGIAGRYPGANHVEELWENLSQGRSNIAHVSLDSVVKGVKTDSAEPDVYLGLLEGKFDFDPLLFHITPAEAKTLDPQERLLLQNVWHCLENSGYTAETLKETAQQVGVFIGAMWSDYDHHVRSSFGEHPSAFLSSIANRISFFNDFKGPSVAVDTSCSSAMTALHFACNSVQQGECQAAIVGGVNLITHPSHLELLNSLELLSGDEQAHPFGLEANGWVAGEGVGTLLIRSLADALENGDQILGVIRATAIGHSGKTLRYGAPKSQSQEASIKQVLANAGLAPDSIGYVEAAVPGASLADGSECAAINSVFATTLDTSGKVESRPLPVGSIKANIGHLESASAMSQIAKVLWQFKHQALAPTLGADPISPVVPFADTRMYVNQALTPWEGPKRALINAFGASGSGGHVILESTQEAGIDLAANKSKTSGPWLFPFSATSVAQLKVLLSTFAEAAKAGELNELSLADVSYTLCVGRVALPYRKVIIACDVTTLIYELELANNILDKEKLPKTKQQAGSQVSSLEGLTKIQLIEVAEQWTLGNQDLAGIERHQCCRVALPLYPFAQAFCHIIDASEAPQALPVNQRLKAQFTEESLIATLEEYLRAGFAKVTGLSLDQIDSDETYDRYGLTSLMITAFNQKLMVDFGELSSTLLFEYQTLSSLAKYLAEHKAEASRRCLGLDASEKTTQAATLNAAYPKSKGIRQQKITPANSSDPIAIVGLAGRYPGAANVREFWENLKNGVDCITEIPKERWANQRFFSDDRNKKGCINTRWGGFLKEIEAFDPLFFNISPRDAERMDPQERLFLQTAWETLEDAGYDRESIQTRYQGSLGVFVGVMHGEYILYSRSLDSNTQADAVDASFGSIANRVSYVLNAKGPSLAVDTICSSSLTALHLAVESLKRGECAIALAGGVNLSLHPNKYFIQSQLTMSSSDGRCRSFGEGGDGFIPGEGVGAILLKPLSLAEQEGDHIYGVIEATSINHDGKTHGYTVPNPNAQAAMIAESLNKAGLDPRALSYIEAHGTGTALGDPVEITGLKRAFAQRSVAMGQPLPETQQCAIGSVKSNIGHLESAAGIAGITKVLLQMQHQQIAPSLHSNQLNTKIPFEQSPFYVPQNLQTWQPSILDKGATSHPYPRIASVSSFGSGGSNGHVILSEYHPKARVLSSEQQDWIIPLSAKTFKQLHQQVRQLLDYLKAQEFGKTTSGVPDQNPPLSDLAYTLQQGREAMECRLAFKASHWDEVLKRLQESLELLEQHSEPKGHYGAICIDNIKHNKAAISALANDEDMVNTLKSWVLKGKFDKLMELWTKGLTLDWSTLMPTTVKPKRMSLPTYPFAKTPCWVSGRPPFTLDRTEFTRNQLHPLVHQNQSTLWQQRFTSEFSGSEFFLQDHRVRDQKILPAVCYLEMLLEVAHRSFGPEFDTEHLHIRQVNWMQPLQLAPDAAESLKVSIDITPDSEASMLKCSVLNAEGGLCCEGEILLTDSVNFTQDNSALNTPVLAELKTAITLHSLAVETLYSLFELVGIAYGADHRALKNIWIENQQVLAELQLPATLMGSFDEYRMHPSLMDAAFQTCLGVMLSEQLDQGLPLVINQTWVPFELGALQKLSAPITQKLWVWVNPRVNQVTTDSPSFNLWLFNEQGEPCLYLEALSLKALSNQDIQSSNLLSSLQANQHITLIENWHLIQNLRRLEEQKPLLLVADADALESLASQPFVSSTLALKESLTEADYVAELKPLAAIEHILWVAPTLSVIEQDLDAFIRGQSLGILSFFRFIKALLTLGWDAKSLQLTVVTEGVVQHSGLPVSEWGSTSLPTHASLYGFVGSLAKEYEHWTIQQLDVESLEALFEQPWKALPVNSNAPVYVQRQQQWYGAHLSACLPEPQFENHSTKYRDQGVYVVIGGAGGIGKLWTEYMVRQYQAKVIWVGRRDLDDSIQASIDAVAQLGVSPEYYSMDASLSAEIQPLVQKIEENHGHIHGVVHAALILNDQSIARLTEKALVQSLRAKVDVSVRLAEAFKGYPLDFMLYFSSLQKFTQSAGQSNYAAGCTFKNAFAYYLNQISNYPVKVMDWGYWGDVGSVATEAYRQRMDALGLGSIEGDQAMQALETLLQAPYQESVFLKMSKPLTEVYSLLHLPSQPDGPLTDYCTCLPPEYPSLVNQSLQSLRDTSEFVRHQELKVSSFKQQLDQLQADILFEQLKGIGCCLQQKVFVKDLVQSLKLTPMFEAWLFKSLQALQERDYIRWQPNSDYSEFEVLYETETGIENLWKQWEKAKEAWLKHPSLKSEVLLSEVMLKALPDILTGKVAATDIMFPEASVALVEGIYKNNPISDYFNDVMLNALVSFIETRLAHDNNARIRILEIGAGTGGTSALAFEKLRPVKQHIQEYCYTDVSQAFLQHARESYGPNNEYLRYRILDVDQPIQDQGFDLGQYDFVLATNVLHATPNMYRTLKHAQALIKANGLLLINEINQNGFFTHLTFGLLKGWWLFEDPEVRLPGGPALASKQWKSLLTRVGFKNIAFPALAQHDLGQQVIIAENSGLIGMSIATQTPDVSLVKPRAVSESIQTQPVQLETREPKSEPTVVGDLKTETLAYLTKHVSELFRIPTEQIDPNERLETYGIDSILVVQLMNRLRKDISGINSALIYEFPTLAGLAEGLVERFAGVLKSALTSHASTQTSGAKAEPRRVLNTPLAAKKMPAHRFQAIPAEKSTIHDSHSASGSFDVAIIGLAGRYANSDSVDELWEHLQQGESCISEIPIKRWDWRRYQCEQQSEHQKQSKQGMYSRWGGFVRDIDCFDPLFFQISPKEAETMDPQERLLLEEAFHCLEDAGYTPERLTGHHRVGVFVGVMNGTYQLQSSYWSVANRISYQFDFKGPSLAVDTACSASLTAIHLAIDSLRSGISDCAMVGGVNLVEHPAHFQGLTEMKMLSSGPDCKAFGEGADGFVDGEGVGVVLLKPLAQAEADGDRIYAVIKGSMINAGGKTQGYTVPSPAAQADLITSAFQKAQINPNKVTYVEAHGTGTALGDPIEIAGLTRAFNRVGQSDEREYCAIGSIKSNIGHCESAAGMAGLTKILLQLQHKKLVPSLHAKTPNPEIDFSQTPFKVQQRLTDWTPNAEGKLLAAISSFGAGGANAHLIVEEYQDNRVVQDILISAANPALIVLSAESETQLLGIVSTLYNEIQKKTLSNKDLAALAYSLQVGRTAKTYRLSMQVESMEELTSRLQQVLNKGLKESHTFGLMFNRVEISNRQPTIAKEQIKQWIAAKEWQTLADAWTQGAQVAWEELYAQVAPIQMRLPGYPFAKESYWKPLRLLESQVFTSSTNLTQSSTLGNNILIENISDVEGLRFRIQIPAQHSMMQDHQVNQQPVLSGAAMLVYMQAVLDSVLPAEEDTATLYSLENVQWQRVFQVTKENQGILYLELVPEGEADSYGLGLYSLVQDEVIQTHALAKVRKTPKKDSTPDFDHSQAQLLDVERCYQDLQRMGMQYGASHRCLNSLKRNGHSVWAQLNLDASQAKGFVSQLENIESDSTVYPEALLDSVFQAVVGLLPLNQTSSELYLPKSIQRFKLYQALPLSVHIQVEQCMEDALGLTFNIAMFSETQHCIGQIEGYQLAKTSAKIPVTDKDTIQLEKRIVDKEFVGAAGLICTPQWIEALLPHSTGQTPRLLRLFMGSEKILNQLLRAAKADGIDSYALSHWDFKEASWGFAQVLRKQLPVTSDLCVQLVMTSENPQWCQGLSGLLACAHQEQPQLLTQVIEVDGRLSLDQLHAVLNDESRHAIHPRVRFELMDGRSYRRTAMHWAFQPMQQQSPTPWKEQGVYLVTGGLGGIGQHIVRDILNVANSRVIICGRAAATSETVQSALATLGSNCRYQSVDLGESEQVEALIETIIKTEGNLTGILHCAGVVQDAALIHKQASDFEKVLKPKMLGALYLDQFSAELPLECFVLCSSLASVLGNTGQVDYGAANGYLDGFARWRNQQVEDGLRSGHTLSVNLPYWEAGGMQMSSAAQQQMLGQWGLLPMDSKQGLQALHQAMALSNHDQVMLMPGDPTQLVQSLARIESRSAVSKVISRQLEGHRLKDSSAAKHQTATPIDTLSFLRQVLANTLKLPELRIEDDQLFERYGVDSLMMMDMTNALEKRFGALPKTLFFEYPSLSALNTYFKDRTPIVQTSDVKDETTPTFALEQGNATPLIKSTLQAILPKGLDSVVIDEQADFADLGLDSLQLVTLTRRLEEYFGDLPEGLLFEHSSISQLADYFNRQPSESLADKTSEIKNTTSRSIPKKRLFKSTKPSNVKTPGQIRNGDISDIAIIGLSGRYPGAETLEQFWENLSQGKDSITEVPTSRWDWRDYYNTDRSLSGVHNSKWGGFLKDIDQFDPMFFNIAPLEADWIDPQERLFLQTAWAAMEDAGYAPVRAGGASSDAQAVGVYVGVMYNEYQLFGAEASAQGQRMGFAASTASIANRVSFCLNLHGPSMSLDSMCSSSLTAIHLACEDLRSGRTKMAIAGGVNLSLHPNKYLLLSKGQYISTEGHCASFGEGGDGYIPGEAVGAVVLKPLAEAERDGDAIYAVIKGSYLNHGGKSTGYSVPDPKAQQAAIEGALLQAGVEGADISYVEAHGTGTKLGDPIEIAGLTHALGSRTDNAPCYIGSAKSNIGHCESAAAMAGLTKILLQLKHQQLVPSLHSQALNPFIDFAATPFEVNQSLRDWPQSETGKPRLAGLSSFGAGGANGHLILAEYSRGEYSQPQPLEAPSDLPHWLVISARDNEGLIRIAQQLSEYLQHLEPTERLCDIAFTLQVGREAMECRAAVQVNSLADAATQLAIAAKGDFNHWLCGSSEEENKALQSFKSEYSDRAQSTWWQWYQSERATEAMSLWVQGLSIDFEEGWKAVLPAPHRVHLPSYPFQTQSYWVPKVTKPNAIGTAALSGKILHPLLQKRCLQERQMQENQSQPEGLHFVSTFDGSEPWLRDHHVNGKAVLPAAAMLEMLRLAVVHSQVKPQATSVQLSYVRWFQPLVVEQTSVQVHLELNALDDGFEIEVWSENGDKTVRHCHALGQALGSYKASSISISELIQKDWSRELSHETIYHMFHDMGIDYGESHRGIQKLYLKDLESGREVLAKLQLKVDQGNYWLPPGVMDSALQTAIGAILPMDANASKPSNPWVPVALNECQILAQCKGPMWVHVLADAEKPEGTELSLSLYDADGNACVLLQGFSAQALQSKSLPSDLKRVNQPEAADNGQMHWLAPVWDPVIAEFNSKEVESRNTVVIGSNTERTQGVLSKLSGARFIEINDFIAGDWESIDWLNLLSEQQSIQALYWVLPTPPEMVVTEENHFHQIMTLACFRMIKALFALGYQSHPLHLTILTENSVQVFAGDSFNPVYAGLDGLIGSLAKEHPGWSVQLLDIPSGQEAITEQLSLELLPDNFSGDWVAWRNQQWWHRRLAPVKHVQPQSNPHSIYTKGAVYLVIGGAGGLGQVWTEHVLRHSDAQVVWVGRRPENQEIKNKIKKLTEIALKHNAPAPVYYQADAADASQLKDIKNQIHNRFGRISAVVQAALVLQDRSLANMDEMEFLKVYSAKANTAVALAKVFDDLHPTMEFIMLFSSMMSFTRQAGQSNYAAGCTFADAFLNWLRLSWSCPIKILNWGYWGSVGAVSSEQYSARMAQLGLGSIEPEEGMNVLDQCLEHTLDQIAFLKTLTGEPLQELPATSGVLSTDQVSIYKNTNGQATTALKERLKQRLHALEPHHIFFSSVFLDKESLPTSKHEDDGSAVR